MKDLFEIEISLKKTSAYLDGKVIDNTLMTLPEADLSCYYKLPMFFIESGKPELAKQILSMICERFLMPDGDFRTRDDLKSIKPEYIEYWTYMNGWILRAAQKIDFRIPDVALEYFKLYDLGKGRFFSHHNARIDLRTTDILSVAHHGLFYLEHGNHDLANEAAKFLCNAFDCQPKGTNQFFLRFDSADQPITAFEPAQQMFFSVQKH